MRIELFHEIGKGILRLGNIFSSKEKRCTLSKSFIFTE